MLKFLKSNALFVSMLTGIVFHDLFAWMAPAIKFLLFLMLLITYCRISPRQLKLKPLHFWLACVQAFGCVFVYLILAPFNLELAQGCLLCILAPTATSAPVFAALLGGSVACLTAYSIASNLSFAFLAPFVLSLLGAHGVTEELTLIQGFLTICARVMPLLLAPFFLAALMKKITPKIHEQLKNRQVFSFWLWVIALTILMAKTTGELLAMEQGMYSAAAVLALGAAVVCVLQFSTGWYLGRKYGDRVSGGQGLGQKNTILIIWMAHTFFNPVVAIAPASYVVWQNLINSYQLLKYRKNVENAEK
ncbi:MAG: transporter [Prevotellaceae bacterium]|jgi:BASS family bile acid:Na+ symporter|nr:transporter [Prevotellaceae bacterium]